MICQHELTKTTSHPLVAPQAARAAPLVVFVVAGWLGLSQVVAGRIEARDARQKVPEERAPVVSELANNRYTQSRVRQTISHKRYPYPVHRRLYSDGKRRQRSSRSMRCEATPRVRRNEKDPAPLPSLQSLTTGLAALHLRRGSRRRWRSRTTR